MAATIASSGSARMRDLLTRSKTIAIVGASEKPDRDSNHVMAYLLAQNYRVIPISPSAPGGVILGQRCFASLKDVPASETIDIVDVFRKADALPGVWAEIRAHAPKAQGVWLQKGLTFEQGARSVRACCIFAWG